MDDEKNLKEYRVILTSKRTTYNYNNQGLRVVEEQNNYIKVFADYYIFKINNSGIDYDVIEFIEKISVDEHIIKASFNTSNIIGVVTCENQKEVTNEN